ncbi:MAG: glycosyltransferase family 39 protein [Sorangiineae bacterium]|nr:glycosyltransferase family 39 protein [Polyangiaceae bacterium]MEB2321590.1 glycosyltransferase family 39 protein [Sorangiineae bacterium]
MVDEEARPEGDDVEAVPAEPAGEAGRADEPAAMEESRGDAPRAAARRPWLTGLAALVTLASLFGPLSASGIWDPPELRVADLARRIAVNLLGARDLVLDGANNAIPTLGELARGQLPFTSVALGFKLFGLHDWAGRLPLALWGMLGVLATWTLIARLADRAAAAFSVLALATMPLYFLHARTILGDIVTMASLAIAVAGLALAAFDRGARWRPAWLLLGVAGMASGFGSRGVLIGVALPALGVGAAWLVLAVGGERRAGDRFGAAIGGFALLTGAIALGLGVNALTHAAAQPARALMTLGVAVDPPRQRPTFDFVIQYLGHGLFPWSAVLPFALGRVLRGPVGIEGPAREREVALRAVLLLVAVTGFGVYGALAPATGHLPYGPVFALAGLAAIALRDFERGAPGSRTVAMGVAAFAVLFYEDFREYPVKALSAFAAGDATFPDSFREPGMAFIRVATLLLIVGFFFSFMERQEPAPRVFDKAEYLRWPRLIRTLWNGNLAFVLLVGEAALVALAALAYLSRTRLHLKQFSGIGEQEYLALYAAWAVLPIAVYLAPAGLMASRDAVRWLYARLPTTRAVGSTTAVVACGAVLSLGYYPRLARQISPKEVFDSYEAHAEKGEALGLVGVSTGSARYYTGGEVPTFPEVTAAFGWLTASRERRWLALRSGDLPQMNSLYRGQTRPAQNLPVLDARSSEILLVSNELRAGEKNENPFRDAILSEPPRPAHPLDGNLGGQLDCLGWSVTDLRDQPVDGIVPLRTYRFKIYYRVVAPIAGNWETFIHIDGFQRRYNGDHKTLGGKYPLNLWRVGDFIVDSHEIALEPNFTPGKYQVFFGLFIGDRRLEVKRGAQSENRLDGGPIRVE